MPAVGIDRVIPPSPGRSPDYAKNNRASRAGRQPSRGIAFLWYNDRSVKLAGVTAMKIGDQFRQFHLEKVKLNLSAFQLEMSFKAIDQDAAWDLYIELLTRIVTQPLPAEAGDEKTALDSVYSLFPTTREILRRHGRGAIEFSKVAIPVLNQIVRPFTAKWHKESLAGAFADPAKRQEFRADLAVLQVDLRNYNRLLADIAGVEDLTDFELTEDE